MVNVNYRNDNLLKKTNNFKLTGSKNGIIILKVITESDYSNSNRISYQDSFNNNHIMEKSSNVNDFSQNFKHYQEQQLKGAIKLSNWINQGHSNDDLREVFINMDLAMKYIHNKGYCINSFNPNDIELLNNSLSQIKYDVLLKMPNNYDAQRELIKEDIYNSAYLHIGIYVKYLDLNHKFLSENYDEFAKFIPNIDVPYYRGVVQRGASVYLSDYVVERKRRDLSTLDQELNTSSNGMQNSKSLVKTNGYNLINEQLLNSNNNINKSIYGQLDRTNEAAFINVILCFIVLTFIGFFMLIYIFFS